MGIRSGSGVGRWEERRSLAGGRVFVARETRKEKAHFMSVAHASLAETETLLTLCEDQGWFPRNETERLRELLDQVSRMLTVLRRGFRGREKSGAEKRGKLPHRPGARRNQGRNKDPS